MKNTAKVLVIGILFLLAGNVNAENVTATVGIEFNNCNNTDIYQNLTIQENTTAFDAINLTVNGDLNYTNYSWGNYINGIRGCMEITGAYCDNPWWSFFVNYESASTGVSSYIIQDNDLIEMVYMIGNDTGAWGCGDSGNFINITVIDDNGGVANASIFLRYLNKDKIYKGSTDVYGKFNKTLNLRKGNYTLIVNKSNIYLEKNLTLAPGDNVYEVVNFSTGNVSKKQDNESCTLNSQCISGKCMNNICISPSKNITIGLAIKFPNGTTFTTYVKVPEYSNGKEILDAANISYNYTNNFLICINGICSPSDWNWYWSFNLHKNYETEWHSMGIGMGPGDEANNFCWNGDYSKFEGHYCALDGDVIGIGLGYGNVPDFYTLKEIYLGITIYFCDDDNDTYFDRNVCGTCDSVNCTPVGCRETEGNDCNDNNNLIHPAANETCNGRDDNCNNIIDEGGVCGCGCESITNSSVVFVCGNKVTESCKMTCDLNCSGDGFIAGADNITIDGANYNLTGHGSGEGIKIEAGGHNNLIIENFNSISHFSNGIITGMGTGGVLTNSIIRNNNVHSNDNVGIAIYDHSDNNQIINNNCHDNGRSGIDLYPSNNCVVNDNLCYNNGQSGINVLHSGNNAVKNNKVYGNGEYGILLLYTNSDNNEITSNEIYNNYYGIFLDGDTDNNKINSNTITNNNYGISIDYLKSVEFANNNKINSNTICNNGDGDINVVAGIGTFGDENTCDIAGGYNDTTANQTSCKYSCSGCVDADGDSYNTTFNGNCGIVDCNDNNSVINPGAAEICTNGVDDNCNTLVDCCDPGCACPQGEICNAADCICIPQAEPGTKPGHKSGHNSRGGCSDNDNDGYNGTAKCSTGTDCDDSNPGIYPGAKEIHCNKIDEDCDGFDLCTGLTGENCTGSEECETGICSGGVCIECESDNDCNTGEYCLLGICEEKKKTGGNCSENYECNSDNCFNGRCIECKLNTDCNPGEYCGNGICKKLITLGDGCKRNEECLTGRCNDGKCACVQDSDCESKYCNDGVCEEKIVEETVILEGAKAPDAAADEKTDAADVQAKEPGFLLSPDAPVLLIILIIIFIILLMFFVKRKGKDEN